MAYCLNSGGWDVTLVEGGNAFGGAVQSVSWGALQLDLGCHLFDNKTDQLTDIFFDMGGGKSEFRPLDVRYASYSQGKLSKGIAVMDLSGLSDHERGALLLDYLRSRTDVASACSSLMEKYIERYGPKLGSFVAFGAKKMFALDAGKISPRGLEVGPFQRVCLIPGASGRLLKQLPELDESLAVSSADCPLEFYPEANSYPARNFYPAKGGLSGFINSLTEVLANRGVALYSNAKLEDVKQMTGHVQVACTHFKQKKFDAVISTISMEGIETEWLGSPRLQSAYHYVPMVLFYARIRPDDLTGLYYVHNYDLKDYAFRISAPGLYGNQVDNEGYTYICFECPTQIGSSLWDEPVGNYVEALTSESVKTGILCSGAKAVDWKKVSAKKTFRLPLVGAEELEARVLRDFSIKYPNLTLFDRDNGAKTDILNEAMRLVSNIESS